MNLYKDSPIIRTCQVLILELLIFIMNSFEERIKYVRGSRTMEEFANLIGATKQKIHNYENGKVKPTFDIFEKLSKAGYNTNWLLTGEGEIYTEKEDRKSTELKREIVRLKEENETVKKMVGLEAYKYIQSQLSSVKNSPQKPPKIIHKKTGKR